jgi:hypothetical protein
VTVFLPEESENYQSMSKLQIYKGHLIERSGRGFKAYYGIFCKWFPLECAAKHWINLEIEKYEQK